MNFDKAVAVASPPYPSETRTNAARRNDAYSLKIEGASTLNHLGKQDPVGISCAVVIPENIDHLSWM